MAEVDAIRYFAEQFVETRDVIKRIAEEASKELRHVTTRAYQAIDPASHIVYDRAAVVIREGRNDGFRIAMQGNASAAEKANIHLALDAVRKEVVYDEIESHRFTRAEFALRTASSKETEALMRRAVSRAVFTEADKDASFGRIKKARSALRLLLPPDLQSMATEALDLRVLERSLFLAERGWKAEARHRASAGSSPRSRQIMRSAIRETPTSLSTAQAKRQRRSRGAQRLKGPMFVGLNPETMIAVEEILASTEPDELVPRLIEMLDYLEPDRTFSSKQFALAVVRAADTASHSEPGSEVGL